MSKGCEHRANRKEKQVFNRSRERHLTSVTGKDI